MWELLKRGALGRPSVRRFSLSVTAFLVAVFALTTAFSPVALAADATRSGDNLTYDSRTFKPMTDTERPSGIQRDVSGFVNLDATNRKAHFIFTTSDPSVAATGQYVVYDFTPPQNFSNPSPPESVGIVNAADADNPGNGNTDGEPVSSCNSASLQGIGWIICPVVNFLASGMDHLYEVLTGFLVVQPAQANSDSSLYRMWTIIRDLANVCFVIGFLIIVFSQVTSIGITNYGIKRTLPRLIIAAVLVNISFWVCALAIDISNMLGYGVHSMFMSVFDSLNSAGQYDQIDWTSTAETVLSGVAVGGLAAAGVYVALGAGLTGTLIMFIPTLVGVLLSILVALLVISVRQALITVLVIISPLAFVAFLLPNLEKWFDKWKDLFITLLLVYPLFSLIFGGAQLAGLTIIQSSGGSLNLIILGMAVQIAPVVVTPMLVKLSGNLVGKIAGMVNNPKAGLMDRTRNWAKERSAEEKARILSGRGSNNWANRATRAIDRHARIRKGTAENYGLAADNRFAGSEAGRRLALERGNLEVDKKNVNTRMMNTTQGHQLRKRQIDSESFATETETAFSRTHYGHAAHTRHEYANIDKTNAESEFSRSTVGRQISIAQREAERTKQHIQAEHEHEWHFRNLHDAGSQEREMNLRIATDRASLGKAKVDATYTELKAGDIRNALVGQGLADNAYTVALETSLTGIRQSEASGEVKTKINEALITNGQDFVLKPDGKPMLDAAGKPIPIVGSHRVIDGRRLQDYATGIGKKETMLASAISESRSDWGKQASAASELISHFKLDSDSVQKLAAGGKDPSGRSVKVSATDDNGNVFEFEADDEYVKEAAIIKQFREGSYGQKMAILKETGESVADVDEHGNPITRRGYNYAHRATAKNEAVASGIAKLAPFINDMAYNEIIKGNFSGDDSIKMHALRQIFEGRVKVDNLSGANNDALEILGSMGVLRDSTNPADRAEFTRYRDLMFDFFADLYGSRTSPKYLEVVSSFDTKFDSYYAETLKSFKQILENSNISRDTSLASKEVIRDILNKNGVRFHER